MKKWREMVSRMHDASERKFYSEGLDEGSNNYPSLNAIRLLRSSVAFNLTAFAANAAASDELVTVARRSSRRKVYGFPSIEFEPSHHDAVRGDKRGGMRQQGGACKACPPLHPSSCTVLSLPHVSSLSCPSRRFDARPKGQGGRVKTRKVKSYRNKSTQVDIICGETLVLSHFIVPCARGLAHTHNHVRTAHSVARWPDGASLSQASDLISWHIVRDDISGYL